MSVFESNNYEWLYLFIKSFVLKEDLFMNILKKLVIITFLSSILAACTTVVEEPYPYYHSYYYDYDPYYVAPVGGVVVEEY